MLAQFVDVRAIPQQFQRGVGVTQRIKRPILPILVLQQACVTDPPPESAVQIGQLVAVTETEQLVGHTQSKFRFKRQVTNVFLPFVSAFQHIHSTVLGNEPPAPVLPS